MNPQLTYLLAQQRIAELRGAAERYRRPPLHPLVLPDGRHLQIRPIEREDRDQLRRLFLRLTPESRYRRYLSPKPELTERELTHLLDIDHVRHEALAAIDERDCSFVAAARYVQIPCHPEAVEAAIEVADDFHRHGIATALAIETLERAHASGFTRVSATVLHENTAARALLRRLHFKPHSRGGPEIEFELELTTLSRPRPARPPRNDASQRKRRGLAKCAR